MNTTTVTWVVILVLRFSYSLPASFEILSQRNLLQLKNMINYKGYNSFDYLNYGCWCGLGNYGTQAVDQSDSCCETHDKCYDSINKGFFACWPKLLVYDWKKQPNKSIVCTDAINRCGRKTCECDKAAADCFASHRTTYQQQFRHMKSSEKSRLCNA